MQQKKNEDLQIEVQKWERKKKERYHRNRKKIVIRNRKFIENYKILNPCYCGETDPCCLSFHHKNGDKVFNISDMINRGYGIKRIKREIDKCDILCLNCHAKLHYKEKEEVKIEKLKNE